MEPSLESIWEQLIHGKKFTLLIFFIKKIKP